MLAHLAIAMILDAATVASPSPAPPATPSLQPLREVVYKVAFFRRQEVAVGHFGGESMDATGNVVFDPRPTSDRKVFKDEGTVTVDIMGIQNDDLLIRVVEALNDRGSPATFNVIVAPNGVTNFGDQDVSVACRYLVPFFGRLFGGSGRSFDPGSKWEVEARNDVVDVIDDYTVSKTEGSTVVLDELQRVKLHSARGMDLTTRGSIKYNPALLAPISGTLQEHGLQTTVDSANSITTDVTFERISDTFDKKP
jgi:hypothetical protein